MLSLLECISFVYCFFTVIDAYWNFLCAMETEKASVFYAACPSVQITIRRHYVIV